MPFIILAICCGKNFKKSVNNCFVWFYTLKEGKMEGGQMASMLLLVIGKLTYWTDCLETVRIQFNANNVKSVTFCVASGFLIRIRVWCQWQKQQIKVTMTKGKVFFASNNN